MSKNDKLNQHLTATLDKSLEFDEETLRELHERRQSVLATKRKRRQPLWAATAAAISILLALPWFYARDTLESAVNQAALPAEYYSVDPEMLEVMDMLIVLGELAEEDPDAI